MDILNIEASFHEPGPPDLFSEKHFPADGLVLQVYTYTHNDYQLRFTGNLEYRYWDKCSDRQRREKLPDAGTPPFSFTTFTGATALPAAVKAALPDWIQAITEGSPSDFVEPDEESWLLDGAVYTLSVCRAGKLAAQFRWEQAGHKTKNELSAFLAAIAPLEEWMQGEISRGRG